MTPDGISTTDWERVKELACKVANASGANDEGLSSEYTNQLLLLLDELQEKYGHLPSILATKADYIENVSESLALLKHAYEIANKQGDKANLTFIASSIARVYIEDLNDRENGQSWLNTLRVCLEERPDETEAMELKRLSEILLKLSEVSQT